MTNEIKPKMDIKEHIALVKTYIAVTERAIRNLTIARTKYHNERRFNYVDTATEHIERREANLTEAKDTLRELLRTERETVRFT